MATPGIGAIFPTLQSFESSSSSSSNSSSSSSDSCSPSSSSLRNVSAWFSSSLSLNSLEVQRLFSESITCGIMLLFSLTFFIGVTKNRLWNTNRYIAAAHKCLLVQMLGPLTDISTFYLLTDPLEKIYVVWGAILMIGHGTLFSSGEATVKDSNSVKVVFIAILTYELVGVTDDIPRDINGQTSSDFVVNLWIIWGLIILKSAERFFSHQAAKRIYENDSTIYNVSNYFRYQDDQHNTADPVYKLQEHKYIVSGEERISLRMEMKHDNKVQMVPVLDDKKIITLDKVWDCKGYLLSCQKFKDLCLSFALMKLLRRRFLDNPNGELIQESKALILLDLIKSNDESDDDMSLTDAQLDRARGWQICYNKNDDAKDKASSRVFQVIKTELGFLEDTFFSMYPIIFGYGLPICNILLSLSLMAATIWILITTASLRTRDSDFFITLILVAMILIMEMIEITTYVFSDWTNVSFLITYVRFPWLQKSYLLNNKLVKFLFKMKNLHPMHGKVGQFSLLINAGLCGQTHAFIEVPESVKKMIVDCLRLSQQAGESQSVHVSNGEKSLERNRKKEELGWACELPTSTQTILVWHIATCYCETIKSSSQSSTGTHHRSVLSNYYKEVATTLSNYCAYLVVQAPDLLPDCCNELPRAIFDDMFKKTDAKDEDAKKMMMMMMKKGEVDEESNSKKRTTARMGVELGKQLVDEIGKEEERWKVLGEFWAEYILYLAPSNKMQAHKKHLASGGEFITHLWVLLYHVGILDRPEKLN